MPRMIAYDAVPDVGGVLPSDLYRMRVESIDTTAKTRDDDIDMNVVTLRVVAGHGTGKDNEGSPYWERFVLGTKDDPTGDDPETQKKGTGFRMWKHFVNACGVPLNPREPLEQTAARCVDKELYVAVLENENDGRRDASRKGMPENKTKGMWALGDPDAKRGIPKGDAKAGAAPSRRTAPKAAPPPPPEPEPEPARAKATGTDLGGGFSFDEE